MTSDIRVRFSNNFVIGIYSGFGIGTELAVSVLSEAAALEMAETDSAATSSERTSKRAKHPRREFPLFMRVRSFMIASTLVPGLLLFALRRPMPRPQNSFSQVVDLTATTLGNTGSQTSSGTRIISPAALVPGTWGAAQIPADRLIGPLVVIDLKLSSAQISVGDIVNWEALHGQVPLGAIVAVRRFGTAHSSTSAPFPVSADAAQFLMDARDTRGFVVETPAGVVSDRTLSRQIALHGNYVVEGSARLAELPQTGALIIVAPGKNNSAAETSVRVLAMVG